MHVFLTEIILQIQLVCIIFATTQKDFIMRTRLLSLLILAMPCFGFAQSDMDSFVEELLARMTLEEKIGQLNLLPAGDITTGKAMESPVGTLAAEGNLGGIFNIKGSEKIEELQKIAVEKSRLKIPLLVGMDVIHGYETIFPIPLAMSCSWDMDAVERAARVAALEASSAGICWTFSPMVDIALDSRWGRIAESAGEDPFLGSRIAEAMVRGYQGDFSEPYNIMACVKHFALYGASESGRDYNTVDMSHLRMHNQYFPPYKAACEAGAGSFMTSFNLVDGVHATANPWLINEVLRNQWKFGGFVVTDYASIAEMETHGFGSLKKNSARALNAGTDMDMCSNGFIGTLKQSVEEGTVKEKDITNACRRILQAKYKLGLFKDPYKFISKKREKKYIYSKGNREVAREIAAETFVLLKNENNLLPLQKTGKIALIGPLANTRDNLTGCWAVAQDASKYKTLKEGFEEALKGKAELLYAQGSNIYADEATQKGAEFGRNIPRLDDSAAKKEALEVASRADVIVCAMGETSDMSGESSSRTDLRLPEVQMSLLKELVATGKPVVLLNFAGRATVLDWESQNVPAIMNVWFGGSETPDAICDVLFGEVSPSGRLTVSMPKSTGQMPLYYNHLNTGRPVSDDAKAFQKYASNYIDVRNGALYPFGYGLSYTTFKYGDMHIDQHGREMTVSVSVTNTGKHDSYEVVQLYIRDLVASIARPAKELKDFERVFIKAGETKRVSLTVNEESLTYYNIKGETIFEPGDFEIMVGPNSREVQKKKETVR